MQTEYDVADELRKLCDSYREMYETEHAKFGKLWDGAMAIIKDPEVPSRHREKLLALLEEVHGKKS